MKAVDWLIRGARVHDGERFLPGGTEVGIAGGLLQVAAQPGLLAGRRVIEAAGLTLAPALMDCHNHGDLRVLTRSGVNLLAQGVGTLLVGQCGFSPWGACGNHAIFLEDQPPPTFRTASAYFDALARADLNFQVVSLAGLHALLPLKSAPDRLRAALDAGCIGLSVGLSYAVQTETTEADLLKLAAVLRTYSDRWSGIAWHMRDQGDGFLNAVREVVRVHVRSGVPCHISHLKLVGLNQPEAIDRALELLAPYPAVSYDSYPYEQSWTVLESVLAVGAKLCGREARREDQAQACARLYLNGWADIVPVSGIPDSDRRRSIADMAREQKRDPVAVYLDLLDRYPRATACYLNQNCASDFEKVVRAKNALVGSDGHIYRAGESGHHPRSFGAFARAWRVCRENRWLTEEALLAKLTGQAAERFGLRDVGRIRDGGAADVCLFDARVFADRASFPAPEALAVGMVAVFRKGRVMYPDHHTRTA